MATYRRDTMPEHTKLEADDLSVTKHEGDPAIELPNGQIICLRTHLEVEDESKTFGGRRVETKTEIDADEFAWWHVIPSGESEYPLVTIQPEVFSSEDV